MKRRAGKTRPLSISVDGETLEILKKEARAHFGGNVSKLISALARETQRRAAISRILDWSGYDQLTRGERDAIDASIEKDLKVQRRRRRAA